MKLTTRAAYAVLPSHLWSAIFEELKLTRSRWVSRLRVKPQKMGQLLSAKEGKLHLGCGTRLNSEWLNVDGNGGPDVDLHWDLRVPLPLASESCRLIYSEHVLEHLVRDDADKLLAECYRLLKPGGKLRLGVPDAELYLQAYVEGRTDFFKDLGHLGGAVKELTNPIDVINQMFRMGGAHQFAWDFAALSAALRDAGFRDIQRHRSGEASTSELCLDDPEHAFETLYVEANKPLVPEQ